MCGRARCTLQREQVAREAGVACEEFVHGDKYTPVENMGPGRYAPVVYQGQALQSDSEKGLKEKHTCLEAMRWGLVPSFTKPDAKPDHFIMFNARYAPRAPAPESSASSVLTCSERPAFKRLVESKRCVVMCDGYYEWQQVDKKEKQPYYFQRRSGVAKFAGLYDVWTNSEGSEMHSFTILTTDIAAELKWLHTRMPVILTDEGVSRWLSDAKFENVKDLLVPYPVRALQWHPVDKRVGSTKFQSEDCATKVDIKHAGDIKSFFAVKTEKQKATDPPTSSAATNGGNASPAKQEPRADAFSKPEQSLTPKKSNAFDSPPRRQQQPRREEDQKSIITESPMKGFVTASSLLTKRASDSIGDTNSDATAIPSPRRQPESSGRSFSPRPSRSSASKKPKTTRPSDRKQGTLLAFFQHKAS